MWYHVISCDIYNWVLSVQTTNFLWLGCALNRCPNQAMKSCPIQNIILFLVLHPWFSDRKYHGNIILLAMYFMISGIRSIGIPFRISHHFWICNASPWFSHRTSVTESLVNTTKKSMAQIFGGSPSALRNPTCEHRLWSCWANFWHQSLQYSLVYVYITVWWFPEIVVPPVIIHFRLGISMK